MKKLLCLILALTLAMSLMVACGKKDDSSKPENDTVATENVQNEDIPKDDNTQEDKKTETPTPSKKPTTKKQNSEPVVDTTSSGKDNKDPYLILDATTNEESITYHLYNCPLLEGKQTQKSTWEMIEMLEFRHCAKCDPPKYEGYVE